jgi:epoxyqueuosine reductase
VNAEPLKERARALGFDLCGVARAGRLERDAEALAAWLRRDYHASMAWMARHAETRADPERLLPGCRSVVVAAANYWPGPEEEAALPGRARVALYARGRDYHKVLGRRLRELAAWLAETTGETARAFVDTGPILERAWAERAGIGWVGKNANLISRHYGSWLLLGEILTTAEIEPDPGPHDDFCGSCTACLEACPTGAIVEAGVVDSRRCISFWTIEHRGAIPEDRHRGIGDWIFGCDECQTVCPWNDRFAVPVPDARFERRDDLRGLDPEAIAGMDEAAFRARYSGTSLMRARWDGMVRNARIVRRNRGG